MEQLKNIILKHVSKYPKMEVTDVIKLVYQNEFGGGHLITNPQNSLNYLIKECESLQSSSDVEYEDIGNGLVRYNLSFLNNDINKINELNDKFVASANSVKGTLKSFLRKIEVVKQVCLDDLLPFTVSQLEQYLLQYSQNNYPMVSHSNTYRLLYKPSYRVIKKDLI